MESDRQKPLAAVVRMLMARDQLAIAQPRAINAALDDWLEQVVSPGQEQAAVQALEVAVTADFSRLRWRMSGPTAVVNPVLSDYLAELEINPAEITRLSKNLTKFKPEQLASWLEVQPEALNTGWSLFQPLSFPQAVLAATPNQAIRKLMDWGSQHSVRNCHELSRTVTPGNPYTELHIELPGPTQERQLVASSQAFATLQVAPIPENLLGGLLNLPHAGLSLAVRLTDDWLSSLSLVVQQPSAELTLYLLDQTGRHEDSRRATFEGLLDVNGPAYLELQQAASGLNLVLHYRLDLETN